MSTLRNRRTGNGHRQWLVGNIPEFSYTFNELDSAFTLLVVPLAINFVPPGNPRGFSTLIDLKGIEEARLTCRIENPLPTGRIKLVGHIPTIALPTPASISTCEDIGYNPVTGAISEIQVPVTGAGLLDSGWIPIRDKYKLNPVSIGLAGIDGNGNTPELNYITFHFR